MQLVVNGITINLASSDYAVTVDSDKTVVEFVGNPNAAPAEDTSEVVPAEPTTLAEETPPVPAKPTAPAKAVPAKGARKRLVDAFGSDESDEEPPTSPLTAWSKVLDSTPPSPSEKARKSASPSPQGRRKRRAAQDRPAPIGTIRRVRQRRSKDCEGDMLMLVTGGTLREPKATWLYSPAETADHSICSGFETDPESDDPDTDDDDTGKGVWAFSDYVVVKEDYDDSVPHRGSFPLCTHFVATDDDANIVSVRPLPKTYWDYIRSFDSPDTRSPIEKIMENVYDSALMRGDQDPDRYAQLLGLVEADTVIVPYDGEGTCEVCGTSGGRKLSFKFGPLLMGRICANYMRLARKAFWAHHVTSKEIVPPLFYLRHRSDATEALQKCAEV